MSQVPSSSDLLWTSTPIFAFWWQAVYNFLGEWSHVNVVLVENHICLGVNLTLLPNDLDELAEGEWTLNRPLSDSNNHTLLFERFRALALY